MDRSHPLYLGICILVAIGLQWLLMRKIRHGLAKHETGLETPGRNTRVGKDAADDPD